MKTRQHPKLLAIAISVGLALLCVTAYAATTVILAVSTIPNSQLFDGPAKVTVRTLTIPPGSSRPARLELGHVTAGNGNSR